MKVTPVLVTEADRLDTHANTRGARLNFATRFDVFISHP